jgi:hypothetical protein
MPDVSTFTWTPKAANVADSIFWVTLQKGQLIEQAWLWIDQPSDNGSSGTIGCSGDTYSVFLMGFPVSGDLYGGSNPSVVFLLNNNHAQVVSATESVSLTWTPGGNPGVTAPRFICKVITEQVY